MTFRVGQKVACIDERPLAPGLGMGTLKKGAIYHIRWTDGRTVRLAEIVRPCGNDQQPRDTPYLSRRFRPVVERKTDISIFTAMLNTSKHGVEA